MKKLSININGYIEGFYGQLLKWPERHLILKKLFNCKFNTYFYCPKEDINHRLNWKQDYSNKWLSAFKNFCKTANKYNINILIGIAPGLDFNFKENDFDFKILAKKAKILKISGASKIVLMFDDIPPPPKNIHINFKNEGVLHAELSNKLSKYLNEEIFVVPRVYCDELIDKKCSYLEDFNKLLKDNIPIFYCGKKIISRTNNKNELTTIRKTSSNKIIFWDNLYANDYCPQKIFIGPYFGRSNFNNTMINPTGLIQTDLFILDLIYFTVINNNFETGWISNLKKYKIPEQFNIISRYLFPINFNQENYLNIYSLNDEIEALDFLLWKWKSSLSREWYKFMLNLKQNLQLLNGDLDFNRIKKIFPVPLKDTLIKFKRR